MRLAAFDGDAQLALGIYIVLESLLSWSNVFPRASRKRRLPILALANIAVTCACLIITYIYVTVKFNKNTWYLALYGGAYMGMVNSYTWCVCVRVCVYIRFFMCVCLCVCVRVCIM